MAVCIAFDEDPERGIGHRVGERNHVNQVPRLAAGRCCSCLREGAANPCLRQDDRFSFQEHWRMFTNSYLSAEHSLLLHHCPSTMKDRIIKDQIRREREAFVRHLREDKGESICALASSYHHGTPCNIFALAHGSFNVCISVQFGESQSQASPDRWVVRIPFPGRVPWIDEKIDSEVATMM